MSTINDFRKSLTDTEINPYTVLEDLGRDENCCSAVLECPFSFASPNSKRQRLYAYFLGHEALVVLADQVYDRLSELADEERFNDENPLWFSEFSHRISPLYILNETANAFPEDYKVTLLMLTSSYIINLSDWREMISPDIIVRHLCKVGLDLPMFEHELTKEARECLDCYHHTISRERLEWGDRLDPTTRKFEPYNLSEQEAASIPEPEEDGDDYVDEDYDFDQLFSFDDESDDNKSAADKKPWEKSAKSPYSSLAEAQREDRAPVRILAPMADPEGELDKLVGMDNIREMLENLVALQSYNKRLYAYIQKAHLCSLHSIFSGAVGTGKTTMAQIMASLLHKAGVLSKGHCVICNRASFVGRQWGTEEQRVIDVIDRAQGGVLLVDEAYSLISEHPHDPGRNVLNLLLEILADEKYRDIAVIFCGYTKEMERLLSFNPGLDSRFPNRFDFRDFTFDELLEISRRKLAEFRYRLTPNAKKKYRGVLRRLYDARPTNWANGREVQNLLELIYKHHSVRCMRQNLFGEELLTIKCCDIPDVQPKSNKNCRRIGFS